MILTYFLNFYFKVTLSRTQLFHLIPPHKGQQTSNVCSYVATYYKKVNIKRRLCLHNLTISYPYSMLYHPRVAADSL